MEQQIIDTLRSIGLNKAEVEVYLDLLRYATSSALEISKRTHLYRSNTYDSLRRLIEKGLVKETVENGKRLFTPQQPQKINDYIKQKIHDIADIVPALNEFSKKTYEDRKAFVSQGPFSLRNALNELIKLNKPIYVFTMSSNVEVFGEGFMEEFHKERAKKKIQLKMIYFQYNPRLSMLNKIPYTEVKYLNLEKDYSSARIFCGDKVYLLTFEKPLTAIEIQSPEIAESFIGTFDLFWKFAQDAEPSSADSNGKK